MLTIGDINEIFRAEEIYCVLLDQIGKLKENILQV